jgi:protein-tyrosine phosphatase
MSIDAEPVRVQLEGAANFRDIGGHRSGGVGKVRHGLVYRSGSLHALTENDRVLLRALGVRTAFDLRSEQERAAEPTDAPFLRPVYVSLTPAGRPLWDGPDLDGATVLFDLYRSLLTDAAGTIGAILVAIAHGGGVPVVIHCSAGKDRTGVVVAVLLLALGVDTETVLDDYELSSRFEARHRVEELTAKLSAAGLPPALAAGLLGTARPALAEALELTRQRFGSFDHYLQSGCGLTRDDLAALRLRLTTS